MLECRTQERARRADSRTVLSDVHVDVAGAGLHRPVHIVYDRDSHLMRRSQKRLRGRMRIPRATHVNGAAGSSPLIFSALPIFLCLEDWKNVCEAPARRAIFG